MTAVVPPLTRSQFRALLLGNVSWQQCADPGTSWRHRMRGTPTFDAAGKQRMNPDGTPAVAVIFVPEEIAWVRLYEAPSYI